MSKKLIELILVCIQNHEIRLLTHWKTPEKKNWEYFSTKNLNFITMGTQKKNELLWKPRESECIPQKATHFNGNPCQTLCLLTNKKRAPWRRNETANGDNAYVESANGWKPIWDRNIRFFGI